MQSSPGYLFRLTSTNDQVLIMPGAGGFVAVARDAATPSLHEVAPVAGNAAGCLQALRRGDDSGFDMVYTS
jgi:hypothetical protein